MRLLPQHEPPFSLEVSLGDRIWGAVSVATVSTSIYYFTVGNDLLALALMWFLTAVAIFGAATLAMPADDEQDQVG